MLLTRIFLTIAAFMGAMAVGGGAFAAHALKERLSERALEVFETGARYQMYHALALTLVALWMHQSALVPGTLVIAGWAFIVGILLFSGSLYALSLSGIKVLGAIAPFGGAAFMLGWLCLAITAWSFK